MSAREIDSLPPLLRPYRMIWAYRHLIWMSTRQLLRGRYAGTVLGRSWIWIGPVLFLFIYAIVFQYLIRGQRIRLDDIGYISQLLAGLAPFLMLSQALTSGCSALAEDKALLLNAVFPAELIPLRAVIVSAVPLAVGVGSALALQLALHGPSWPLLLLPLLLAAFAGFTVALVWFVSLLNLILPDVSQMINYLMLVFLTATPIGYSYDSVHGIMIILVYANPLSYFVVPLQEILAYGRWPPIDYLGPGLLLAGVAFHGLFTVFQKVKRVALDFI